MIIPCIRNHWCFGNHPPPPQKKNVGPARLVHSLVTDPCNSSGNSEPETRAKSRSPPKTPKTGTLILKFQPPKRLPLKHPKQKRQSLEFLDTFKRKDKVTIIWFWWVNKNGNKNPSCAKRPWNSWHGNDFYHVIQDGSCRAYLPGADANVTWFRRSQSCLRSWWNCEGKKQPQEQGRLKNLCCWATQKRSIESLTCKIKVMFYRCACYLFYSLYTYSYMI